MSSSVIQIKRIKKSTIPGVLAIVGFLGLFWFSKIFRPFLKQFNPFFITFLSLKYDSSNA